MNANRQIFLSRCLEGPEVCLAGRTDQRVKASDPSVHGSHGVLRGDVHVDVAGPPPSHDDVMPSRQQLHHGSADGSGASNHNDAHQASSDRRVSGPLGRCEAIMSRVVARNQAAFAIAERREPRPRSRGRRPQDRWLSPHGSRDPRAGAGDGAGVLVAPRPEPVPWGAERQGNRCRAVARAHGGGGAVHVRTRAR